MTITAKVARLLSPRELIFEDEPLNPERLVDGSIWAETEVSAVSVGTERAAYVGDPPLRPGKVYPRLVGYCNVAVVRGSKSAALPVGARILTHQSHRSAFACAASDVLATLPQGVDSAEASVAYLAHLGLAALRRVGHVAGERVTVVGLGAIGLATIAVARAFGSEVTAIANAPERAEFAKAMGANAVSETVADESADVVVTTANTWAAWELALRAAAKFGRIAVLGFPGRTTGPPLLNPFDSRWFYDKQLAIFAAGFPVSTSARPRSESEVLAEGMGLIIRLLAAGKLSLAPLVTDRVPWSALRDIYERASAGDKKLVTAVLDWTGRTR